MSTVVVTGGAGKLGRATVAALLAGGHPVIATDTRIPAGFPVPVRVGNLLDRESAYRLLEGGSVLVHLANHPSFSLGDAQRVFTENTAMNIHAFQAALELGYRKIIFSSSIQVTSGERFRERRPDCILPYLPADGDLPAQPGNPYALSKQVGEVQLAYYAAHGIAEAIAIRFPFLADPDDLPGAPDGRPWRGRRNELFAYLALPDAGSLIRRTAETALPGFRTYFAAARRPVNGIPVEELLRTEFAGVPLRTEASRIDALVDCSRIRAETGWEPVL